MLFQRAIALLLDTIVAGVLAGLVLGRGLVFSGLVFEVVALAYNWYFWTRQDGQTPGKMLMGLRVIKEGGGKISDMEAVIRFVGYHINTVVFFIGWVWAIFLDGKNRGWHDLLAGTRVVKA